MATLVDKVDAMTALFALCEAIQKSELTVNDLTDICKMSIEDGHD